MERLTDEQAAAIGRVLETADGYCHVCAGDLADEMAAIWPEHDWHGLVGTPTIEDAIDICGVEGGAVVYGPDDAA